VIVLRLVLVPLDHAQTKLKKTVSSQNYILSGSPIPHVSNVDR
jgi:hypothetical protein